MKPFAPGCSQPLRRLALPLVAASAGMLIGCSSGGPPVAPAAAGSASASSGSPGAARPGPGTASTAASPTGPNAPIGPTGPLGSSAAASAGSARLPPAPATVRNWSDYQLRAAHRLLAANPGGTYTGRPQDVLLAIPVLEIELNADGSVRRIGVLRRPGQAPETVQLAIDAVRRAAPFGDVRQLPRPWKFNEVFLFNDDRRFKPRTLDGG